MKLKTATFNYDELIGVILIQTRENFPNPFDFFRPKLYFKFIGFFINWYSV